MWLKPCALEKDRDRAQHQMQMLGVRNQRQENQQRQRVHPPDALRRRAMSSSSQSPAR